MSEAVMDLEEELEHFVKLNVAKQQVEMRGFVVLVIGGGDSCFDCDIWVGCSDVLTQVRAIPTPGVPHNQRPPVWQDAGGRQKSGGGGHCARGAGGYCWLVIVYVSTSNLTPYLLHPTLTPGAPPDLGPHAGLSSCVSLLYQTPGQG